MLLAVPCLSACMRPACKDGFPTWRCTGQVGVYMDLAACWSGEGFDRVACCEDLECSVSTGVRSLTFAADRSRHEVRAADDGAGCMRMTRVARACQGVS